MLRAWWSDARVSFQSAHYPIGGDGHGAEAAPGCRLPIWIGGKSEAA